ncbi:MAG: UDP-N-acetylmuramoyl-L-alanine--D-glutamate ligase, partial [Clostridia bacterium]|nr:UDP-N-acetylmuramoyl-L-alanine--D-glutamate ligase [Clostridia bacterium]
KCVLILGGYDKGVSYAPLAEATRGLRGAVLCGANADKIESAIKNNTQIKKATRLEDAVMLAVEMAREGDAVLLSPASASFDMFNSYKEREQKFKEIVRGLKWKKSGSF